MVSFMGYFNNHANKMDHKIALIFPGQGSQAIGMGQSVYEEFIMARDIAEKANHSLGYSLTNLMFYGPSEKLNQTRYTQPAIFITSVMLLKALEAFYGNNFYSKIFCVAGHSIGEYAALAATDSLPFNQLLDLIQTRAIAMEEASPKDQMGLPKGVMCALLGVDKEKLVPLIKEQFGEDPYHCVIANDNCPGQVVITGIREDVEKIRDIALEQGAKKGVILPVSGPFHSAWMQPAVDILCEKLKHLTLKNCRMPLISNVTAQPITLASDLKNFIPQQVASPLRWQESIDTMVKMGINTFVEVGNGQILTGISRRCAPKSHFLSIQTSEDVRQFESMLLSL